MTIKGLPFFVAGKVVKGFGRGSKELGIPTANFPESVVERLPVTIGTGVYFGYARVDDGPVYNMVMSVGWNPFYKNDKKSMETHIMHQFGGDFYGATLQVCMVGFMRPEKNFHSLDELIGAIQADIAQAEELCGRPEHRQLCADPFFGRTLVELRMAEETSSIGGQVHRDRPAADVRAGGGGALHGEDVTTHGTDQAHL